MAGIIDMKPTVLTTTFSHFVPFRVFFISLVFSLSHANILPLAARAIEARAKSFIVLIISVIFIVVSTCIEDRVISLFYITQSSIALGVFSFDVMSKNEDSSTMVALRLKRVLKE